MECAANELETKIKPRTRARGLKNILELRGFRTFISLPPHPENKLKIRLRLRK
jgi:hypothetical protein